MGGVKITKWEELPPGHTGRAQEDATRATGVTSLHAPPAAPPGLTTTTRLGQELGNRGVTVNQLPGGR